MKRKQFSPIRARVGRKSALPMIEVAAAVSLVLNLILEGLSRRSAIAPFRFFVSNFPAFALSWAVITVTLCVAMLFRKKIFSVTLVSVLWLALGIADNIILGRRTGSPLSPVDLQLNMEAILMLPIYYKWWQIVLGALVIGGAVTGLVFLFIKTPKYQKEHGKGFLRLLIAAVICAALVFLCIGGGYVSRSLRPSLYDAYLDNGFAYSFLYGMFDTGIREPETYSGEAVKQVGQSADMEIDVEEEPEKRFAEEFREFVRNGLFEHEPEGYGAEAVETISKLIGPGSADAEVPNIIFVQIEAFFDPSVLTSYKFDGEPIPGFKKLMSEYPSGQLFVPTVSGGTANTEFEVLTGCNLDFFGAGEFPFYTVAKDGVVESLATDLKACGLSATFLHNYTGSFYYRNTVYDNLCFDRFVSLEYMDDYEVTPKGWAKDKVLETCMLDAMSKTEGRDFVYAVTVQTHGAYPENVPGFTPAFTVTEAPGENEKAQMEYYLTQMSEVDAFITHLTETFADYPEDTMIVFFGDHLPGLQFEVDDLTDKNLYATRYVIWANFPLEKADRDIEAYQLGAYALKMAGADRGVMVRYHQNRMDSADYMDGMQIIEYDIMYGKKYAYGEHELSRGQEMIYGLKDCAVTNAYVQYGNLFVEGTGFTSACRIHADGREEDTIFVNDGLLIVPDMEELPEETLSVCFTAADGVILSTVEYAYENTGL